MREPTRQQNRIEPPLDRTTLAVATLASVLGAMLTSALGSGFLVSLLAAALVPAVTAFLIHPGPHRRRRVGAVLTLILLLRGGRDAVAKRSRTAHIHPRRHRVGPAFHASMAFVGAIVALTLVELLIGHAALADRRLTLLPEAPASLVAKTEGPSSSPVIVVPEGPVVRRASSSTGARVTYLARAVDPEGDRLTPQCSPPSGSRFPLGRTVVRCTVTDGEGLTASARFIVKVEAGDVLGAEASGRTELAERPRRDRVAPRLDLPEDIETGASGVVEYTASAIDDRDGRVKVTCTPPSGSSFPVGRSLVVCSASDRAGNVARGRFTVIVRAAAADALPPRLRLPRLIEREAADRSGTVIEYGVRARDDRDGPVGVVCEPPSGSRFPVGRTVVRCSATDGSGNVARGRFAVLVRMAPADVTPPRLDLPQDIETGAPGVVEYTASAIDDRDGPIKVTCTPPSGSRFAVGRTVVACSAADRAGNVARGSFAVTVRAAEEVDDDAPNLDLPDLVEVEATGASGAVVEYAARAVDRRDGPVEVDCRPRSGSLFPIGETIVRCRASDRVGNVARGNFAILVREPADTVPPRLRLPRTITRTTTDSSGTAVDYVASAVDGEELVPIDCSPASGSRFPVGETVVRCSAADRAGNVATGEFTVVVNLPFE